MADINTGRPNHIEDALVKIHSGQWFTWTDSKNKIYGNLRLTEKVGVDDNIVDNPVTELPTESAVNAKLKELQDAWDAANGG
jgi:tetrahydromethanopterin S-methyltransferase subunit H|tara:strand:+ start:666 stop:911 length:246 start_codon:yes stop_codon:yes gene_type:complete